MAPFELDQSCGFLIHDTARLIRRRFDMAIRDLDLTQAKWRVLASLRQVPGITQSELAERLDIGKAPLGLALEWLEQAGWIRREVDQWDRRARRVYLMAQAEPTLALMDQRFSAVESNYLRGFDTPEIEQLLHSLQLIRDELRRLTGSSPGPAEPTETYVSVLFECARLLMRRFDARLAELGFTRNEWLVLNTVHRHEGLRQTEITEATEIAAAPLGKLVDSLEQGQWLERRADPRDRRAKRLYLTRRAHHVLNSVRQRFEQLHAGLEQSLGSRPKQHLVSALGWIRQRLLEEALHTSDNRRAGARS
jgi:MarR family transcriptional regulator, transcriptional regulator for hemolysin